MDLRKQYQDETGAKAFVADTISQYSGAYVRWIEAKVAQLTTERDAARAEVERLKAAGLHARKLVDVHWRFDSYQQPVSSWHELQDLRNQLRMMFPTPESDRG